MKKPFIVVAFVLAILFVVGYGLFLISKSRTFQFFGTITNRITTNDKIVALTFDDAPNGKSDEVLHILAEKNVKATFYVIGGNIEKYPEEMKHIVLAGHAVGNHSYSHQRFLLKSLPFIDSEIRKTDALIRDSGYTGEITFRPPNGKKLFLLPWYLSQNHIRTVTWDVEPDTFVPGDAKAIVKYTIDHVKPGSIILLHPFCDVECEADRKALPIIIDKLKGLGYTFATI